jgi:hypothetical protein
VNILKQEIMFMLKRKKNRGEEQEFVDSAAVVSETGVADETADSSETADSVEKTPEESQATEADKADVGTQENGETMGADAVTPVEAEGLDGTDEVSETEEDADPEGADSEGADSEGVDSEGADSDDEDSAMVAFEAWLEDAVPEEERREAARRTMSMVREALRSGSYDDALFDVIAKGAYYDRAVEEAELAGEVRGRNASIDELMTIEEDGDGVPHPGSGGGDVGNRAPSIFDLAREVY